MTRTATIGGWMSTTRILIVAFVSIATVSLLVALWEFLLEDPVLQSLLDRHESESFESASSSSLWPRLLPRWPSWRSCR